MAEYQFGSYEKLDSYDWGKEQRGGHQTVKGATIYDWDTLLNGAIYRLRRGEGMSCNAFSFRNMFLSKARNHGLYGMAKIEDVDTVVIQASTVNLRKKIKQERSLTTHGSKLRGRDDMYVKVVRYTQNRSHVSQRAVRDFFSIGVKMTKQIFAQMLEDGYILDFNKSINAYPTANKAETEAERSNIVVTTSHDAADKVHTDESDTTHDQGEYLVVSAIDSKGRTDWMIFRRSSDGVMRATGYEFATLDEANKHVDELNKESVND